MANIFLKFQGGKVPIKGESQDKGHKEEIEIFSFSWDENQKSTEAVQGKGKGAATVEVKSVTLSTSISSASPKLMLACATGGHYDKATLACRKAGATEAYLTFVFSDVIVSKYGITAAADDVPMESISLSFSKIEMEYRQQDEKGNLGGTTQNWFDLKTNEGG